MAKKKITQGNVTIEIDETLAPPPDAGTKSPAQLAKLVKARGGVGLALDAAATSIEDGTTDFVPPKGITPAVLRAAAKKADGADTVLAAIDVLRELFRQTNLIWDSEAAALLGRVNDQVKAQAKGDQRIGVAFAAVTEYFANAKKNGKGP